MRGQQRLLSQGMADTSSARRSKRQTAGALFLLFAGLASSLPAQQDSLLPKKVVLRSGRVTTCVVKQGCTEEKNGDRPAYVMQADGFTVRVSMLFSERNTQADIAITNQSGLQVQVIPAAFRLEMSEPKLKSISAETGSEPLEETPRPYHSHGLPPPSYWTSAEHARDVEERKATDTALFSAGPLAPSQTAQGRVKFGEVKNAHELSLIVPVGSAVFEFPYAPPVALSRKARRRARHPEPEPAVNLEIASAKL